MGVALQSNSQLISDLRQRGYEIEQSNGRYFVKIDGYRIEVEEGDTAWTLAQKLENAEREAKLKGEITEGQTKVKEYAQKFQEALDMVSKLRKNFWSFLRENNATTLSDLSGEKYEEGKSIEEQRSFAQTERNRYLHLTVSTANETVSLCLNA